MKILVIANYNFRSKLGGAENRILELAKVLSKYASIEVLHRGSSMVVRDTKFIGYKSIFPSSSWISDAVSLYVDYISPDFYRVLKKAIYDVDIVQVEGSYLLIPTLILTKVLDIDPLIVLDEHNVDFASIKSKISGVSLNSMFTAETLLYVFLSEKLAVKNADLILCVSQTDRNLFTKLYHIPENKLVVIPNGVNFNKFETASPINNPIFKNKKTIFFHGTLSWYPNLEAANIIVDYLAHEIPEAMFLIAGANPPLSLIRKIEKTRNVRYLGYLENLEGWIKASTVCIAPILRGGGTKLKILEYAAAGKPIVATFKAVEGLGMFNKVHGLFYKSVNEEFISGIRRLLKCDQLAQELGWNARQLARKYDWTLIGKKLYETYCRLIDQHV
jgi:glycosyltransferase involved in cell wall biosynthesis